MSDTNSRRQFLYSASIAVSGIIAGCSGNVLDDSSGGVASESSTNTPTANSTAAPNSTETELKGRISELEQRVEELKSARDTKEEKITSLEQELSSLRSKVDQKDTNIEELEEEVTQKERRIEELESQAGQQSEFSADVRSQAKSVAEMVREAVVVIRGDNGGGGTAWFIDDDTLVTNSHVVEGQSGFECWTINGESFSPTLLGRSGYLNQPYHDVAVLETDFSPETTLSLGESTSLTTDQPVVQVGHPFSVGDWVVSLGRYVRDGFDDTVVTSVPSASGNSGGPLVNLDGDVVGITSGGINADSDSSGGDPEPVALELLEEYETTTYTKHNATTVIAKYVEKFS